MIGKNLPFAASKLTYEPLPQDDPNSASDIALAKRELSWSPSELIQALPPGM